MRREQLPRDEHGHVVGAWRLRHRLSDFCEGLGFVSFECGVSTAPLEGAILERVMAALGDDVDAQPWDGQVSTVDDDGLCEVSPTPVIVPSASLTQALKDGSADIASLNEDALRAVAASLGCADKRWKTPRLRRFIADALGLELGEHDA